ncbi:MAG: hypothetical protein RIQ81_236 [Pseudomonadota bacterium]|jgi:phosphoribosylaminoimidazole-succinocarboxamide synthase
MSQETSSFMGLAQKCRIGFYSSSAPDGNAAKPLIDLLHECGLDVDLCHLPALPDSAELTGQRSRQPHSGDDHPLCDAYFAGVGSESSLPIVSGLRLAMGYPVRRIHLSLGVAVESDPSMQDELRHFREVATAAGVNFSIGPVPEPDALNIQIVPLNEKDPPAKQNGNGSAPVSIFVPWLDFQGKSDPQAASLLQEKMKSGGLWFGAGNLRSAAVFAARITTTRPGPAMIYRGSVKNVFRGTTPGTLLFEYSDRYSVFDWGPMPDLILGKGEALAAIADTIFRHVGTRHHSRGLVAVGSRFLAVDEVDVKRPGRTPRGWDYSAYENAPVNCLVPLEVVFRFGVPVGSSLPGRLKADPVYMKDIGLFEVPELGACFNKPVIEFSTKLEDSDRYLSRAEARRISGTTRDEFARLEELALSIATTLRDLFRSAGLDLQDGKLEFAFASPVDDAVGRQFILVDSIGPDELRLTHDGVQLSKEILRQYYVGGSWHAAVARAKKIAAERSCDWRAVCADELGEKPEPLTPEISNIAANIYPSIANSLARAFGERTPFPAAWDLSQLVGRVREAGLA